jgi:16S rRNA (uracil1498-N3)-methyltransferase
MRIPRLYCPTLAVGGNVLSAEESHHAARVLRLREGEGVVLFNGEGREGAGVIRRIRSREIDVEVESVVSRAFETRHKITLAVALPKSHRHAYLIEKCTELGVAGFWPIVSERSVTEPGDGAVEKWWRRAVEAAKQSHRAWLPSFREPQSFAQAAGRIPEFTAAGVGDLEGTDPWPAFLSRQPPGASILVFIGPEGGFTPVESNQLVAGGACRVRLAPTVLRTETAAIAACAGEAALSAVCDQLSGPCDVPPRL